MSEIIIADNEFITLKYLADHKTIYHVIHKPVGGQDLRVPLNKGTEALAQHGACKWLSDDRKNGPLSKEDQEWGFNDWNRRTIAAGWKYWALIVSEEIVNTGTMVPMMEDVFELGLRMMVFTTVEEGLAWLDQMPD